MNDPPHSSLRAPERGAAIHLSSFLSFISPEIKRKMGCRVGLIALLAMTTFCYLSVTYISRSLEAGKPRGNPSAFFFLITFPSLSLLSPATSEVKRKVDCHAPNGARNDECGGSFIY